MKYLINYFHYLIITVILICLVFVNAHINEKSVSTEAQAVPLIIIDAGHGGMDGGAVAADGTQEQYINLAICLKMSKYLNAKGYSTLLTRETDASIHDPSADTIRKQKVSDIKNRLKIAEENENCIFISVHQNYFAESKYSGTQIFYSPNNPESEILAGYVQKRVVEKLQPHNTRQIKECDDSIYLMYHISQIAILAECGFLSNYDETEKLKTEEYQQAMAESICDGIIEYIQNSGEVVTQLH